MAAEERNSLLAPMLLVAALTGMRRGELCALRWSDVRLDTAQLEVARSVVVIDGGVAEKSTKTDRVRHVALDDVARDVVVRRFDQVTALARAVGA